MKSENVPSRIEAENISDIHEKMENYSEKLLELAKKDPHVAQAINLALGIAMQSLYASIQILAKSQEDLSSDLRACIDEVAQDYAEYESSQLKRRVDQTIEQQNKRIERQAEALT